MESQDTQIEQIPLNTKVAMPLVNKKKIVLLPNSPLYISDRCIFELHLSWLGKSHQKKTETNRDESKAGKKKNPNLQLLNNSLSLTTTCISEAEYATNFGSVQWKEMEVGMDQATQKTKSV